jgi:hypothetical protein
MFQQSIWINAVSLSDKLTNKGSKTGQFGHDGIPAKITVSAY